MGKKEIHRSSESGVVPPQPTFKPAVEAGAPFSLPALGEAVQRSARDPQMLRPRDLVQLQRTLGNQATLRRLAIQPRLTVGAAGDRYEQEADQTATRVLAMPDPGSRQAGAGVEAAPLAEGLAPVQRRPEADPQGGFDAGAQVESRLAANQGSGRALPEEVRNYMEPRFGADFGGVRVHTDSEAAQLNRQLNAQAFTHGNDIYMGEGKSVDDKALLAHELTHTIQQTGGVRRKTEPGSSTEAPDITTPIPGNRMVQRVRVPNLPDDPLKVAGRYASDQIELGDCSLAQLDALIPKLPAEDRAIARAMRQKKAAALQRIEDYRQALPSTDELEQSAPNRNVSYKFASVSYQAVPDGDTTSLDVNVLSHLNRLKTLIDNPYKISQGGYQVCGAAAYMVTVLREDPEAFVKYFLKMIKKGKARLGNQKLKASDKARNKECHQFPTADLIALGAYRDAKNKMLRITKGDWSGGTMNWEIEKWFREYGLTDVVKKSNLLSGHSAADLQEASNLYGQGYQVVLSTDERCVRTSSGNPRPADKIPDPAGIKNGILNVHAKAHYVVMASPVTASGHSFRFKAFTWGNIEEVKIAKDNIKDLFFGFIAARWPVDSLEDESESESESSEKSTDSSEGASESTSSTSDSGTSSSHASGEDKEEKGGEADAIEKKTGLDARGALDLIDALAE